MQRTINHTGRKKILRENVQITLVEQELGPPSFEIKLSLIDMNLSSHANVYVEAYTGSIVQRFKCGTVGLPILGERSFLTQVDLTKKILFRVKVVDETDKVGILLAFADRLSVSSEQPNKNLLPIVRRPLGENIWAMEFSGEQPELVLNKNIPNAVDRMKSDIKFQALILPAALREILMFYLLQDVDEALEEDEYARKWLHFVEHIHTARPEFDGTQDTLSWINGAVQEFCNRFRLCTSFNKVWEFE